MSEELRQASDEELLRRAKEDPGAAGRIAAGELLGRYSERVYLYCFRMVRERERALDLAQDAMIDALRGLGRFEGRSRFSSWIFAVARNRCRTALRPRSLTRDEEIETDDLPGREADPESQWIDREGEDALDRLVTENLAPGEREAIWLRCVEGMPVDEITRVLELPNATGARGRLPSARRWRRAALERRRFERGEGGTDGR